MVVKKNHLGLVKKLTKQVKMLERKETKSRRQLSSAFKKIRKLGRTYKNKLSITLRTMKAKIAEAKTSTYIKVAADFECKMLKNIKAKAKAKALALAIAKIEKKHSAKLIKNLAKKGKKPGKIKKISHVTSLKIKKAKQPRKKQRRK